MNCAAHFLIEQHILRKFIYTRIISNRDLSEPVCSRNLENVVEQLLPFYSRAFYNFSILNFQRNILYFLSQIMDIIAEAARTGNVGDGKIFVTDASEAMRIRTGETGVWAV